MVLKLCLQKKEKMDNGDIYTFNAEGKIIQCDRGKSIELIRRYRPSERNCQTDGVRISLKAGYGNLKTVGNSEKSTAVNMMHGVHIYTGKTYEKKCTVFENDIYFLTVMQNMAFIQANARYLKLIDNAEICDIKKRKIETPYGVGAIDDLSTGLKTLLNIIYLKQRTSTPALVNIDECGDNVFPYIFREVNNTNIGLYLSHTIFELPKEYTVYVNNKKVKDIHELLNIIWSGDDEQ